MFLLVVLSVLAAASPSTTTAWIDGSASTTAPYPVTWADKSTSATTAYTNWAAGITAGTNTLLFIDSTKNGQWDLAEATDDKASICQKTF